MIPTFSARGRDQPAKRAGGRQAAEAGCHRVQRARFGGEAQAHLQARHAQRRHTAADAVEHASSARTAVEITSNAASSTAPDVSNVLPTSRHEQRRTQHALSALVQPALVMSLPWKKVGITPERWLKARRPWQTATFSTAEQSLGAKDEWSNSHSTRPRRASSWRGRRGKISLEKTSA